MTVAEFHQRVADCRIPVHADMESCGPIVRTALLSEASGKEAEIKDLYLFASRMAQSWVEKARAAAAIHRQARDQASKERRVAAENAAQDWREAKNGAKVALGVLARIHQSIIRASIEMEIFERRLPHG